MTFELLDYSAIQRQIFGICPKCLDFFRLSDCKIYLKKKPALTWLDKIDRQDDRLDDKEAELREMEERIRAEARKKGQRLAKYAVRKVDPIFAPRNLDANDAKIIFDPVDYLVFNGMSNRVIQSIVFLDRQNRPAKQQKIQKSIANVIQTRQYEWETLRVRENGEIETE